MGIGIVRKSLVGGKGHKQRDKTWKNLINIAKV